MEKLMHDFFCADPDDMYFEPLARAAGYFKKDDTGVKTMSEIMEAVRNEGKTEEKTETVLRMLKLGGFPLETIAKVALMSIDEVRAIAENQRQRAS